MKKNIVLVSLILVLVLCLEPLKAGNETVGSSKGGNFVKVGAAGGQFLKIPYGARGNAMGGAFTSEANDLSSVYWNAAGLSQVSGMTAEFSYTSWMAGFSHNYGGFALPMGKNYVTALSIISFGKSNIPITTMEKQEGTGTKYSINDIAASLTFAGNLTEQFSFGITAKYIQNAFHNVEASGIAFDVGTLYKTGIQDIKLGFAIFNLGAQQNYEGQSLRTTKAINDNLWGTPLDAAFLSYNFSLPIAFRAGISSELWKDGDHKLTGEADFITLSDSPEQYALGAEYVWADLLAIRAGYTFGSDQLGFSGGIGINYLSGSMGGKLDYSISPTANLGLVNRLSISLNFGSN